MTFAISTLATQLFTTQNLDSEQNTLAQLNQQVASGQEYDNLTNYAPVDAHNLMDFQNAITQRQAYLSGMTTVNSRLSMYNTTMTDMETITSQAQTLASGNQTYNASTVAQIQAQTQSYLQQMESDLNQQVSGRYVYGGTDYSTAPVANLASLGAPTLPFTPTTSPTLPDYSAQYVPSNSVTVSANPPTGKFQIGNSSIQWSAIAQGTSPITVTTASGTVSVPVSGLTAGASTPAQLASNLQKVVTAVAAAGTVSDFPSSLSATVDGTNPAQVDFTYSGNPITITPDSGSTTTGEVAWADGTDGTSSENMATTNAAAYAQDSVTVDNGYNVQYGVTSNATGFQQVIAGLRLMNAATSQTDPTTYQTDMEQASTLLTNGLSNIQSLHATVANNTNILTQETNLQNTDITNLQDQISNISQVNLTSVGTQINLLQTQLQASYSATATLIQESILKYL